MSKQIDHLQRRDQAVFSKLTAKDWQSYAGQVLAIDPESDFILDVGKSEAELESRNQFDCRVVEFFHVPEAGSLTAE